MISRYHVSNCMGRLQVIVDSDEIMVVYSICMTAVCCVVFVPYCAASSEIVFLVFFNLCSFLALCDYFAKICNFDKIISC
jgi:hypothetical protein